LKSAIPFGKAGPGGRRFLPFLLLALAFGLAHAGPASAQAGKKGDRGKAAKKTSARTAPVRKSALILVAKLTNDGTIIPRGIVWRVFKTSKTKTGRLELVATGTGGPSTFQLPRGTYLVHAAYGRAGATARITMEAESRQEVLVINAGGLRLRAIVAEDIPINTPNLTFDIYISHAEEGRKVIHKGVKPGEILRLNADTYQVVSHYGSVNAVTSAEIEVVAGKLTDVTMYHQAAKITLKLVNEVGGEALANTSWSVLSLNGDTIIEETGAFPSFVLAEGSYAVVARHGGKVYNKEFSVEAGVNKEEEITISFK